jgi:hypothetical protein
MNEIKRKDKEKREKELRIDSQISQFKKVFSYNTNVGNYIDLMS